MSSLVEQQHHQNIQMRSQNLILRKILVSVSVNVPIHIPDVPDISSLTKVTTTSTSNITHSPVCDFLHSHLVPANEEKKIWFHTQIFDVAYFSFEFKSSIRETKNNANIYFLV